MEDWELSAEKAERIYDKKQELRSLKDYLLKLDVKRSFADAGSPGFKELDSRYSDAEQKRDALESEIGRMEADYQAWLGSRR